MKNILLSLLLGFSSLLIAQQTFQTTIKTSTDLFVSNSICLENSYLILCVNYLPNNSASGIVYQIDQIGQLHDSLVIENDGFGATVNKAIILENGLIRLFCTKEQQGSAGFYDICLIDIDEDLNIIQELQYDIGIGKGWSHINEVIKENGDIILASMVDGSPPQSGTQYIDKCLMKIKQNGDLLFDSVYNQSGLEITMDFLEFPNSNNYILYCIQNFDAGIFLKQINILNSDLEFVENKWIEDFSLQASMRNFGDEDFVICNKKEIDNGGWYTAVSTYDIGFERTNQILLGSSDSASYPGLYNSIAFGENETMFIGSTYNLGVDAYPNRESYFRLDNLDYELNLNWQRYFGGDAYYNLIDINETPDGGCILVGTRYEHGTQGPFEKDVFIVKVDEDGLITSTNSNAGIPIKNAIVLPNPGREYLELHTGAFPATLQLLNLNGSLVLEEAINSNISRVNTLELSSGTYIWSLVKEGKVVESGKWVRE
ncbi:T9SS type A sorting domain-containing protein [Lentimicrobium sp. S6]|uniref:T9SS type A sorting domain-containing protein n=1 Tax=Lentimicrobium sp. S6 TaxID=2735872 RepID=UPI0015538746|nr:T9SS type A sorting domain-containing protein [Lentimicrobium sp. S6]NPD47885.1 T9SS type A sorting domain-containing protein [Lentimicrobium sp. S6]